jgi:ABC-2 type transport system ATP-binding protein
MSVMLDIQGLSKKYQKAQRLALDGLSLSVDVGSIYAFVGPNGAGKTTAIRIMTALLAYDEGSVRIGGYEVGTHPRDIRQLVGYIPDEFGFYEDMLVSEYLEFFSRCYGIDAVQRNVLTADLLELVGLAMRRDEPVGALSRGMRQRLGLARALINDPELIVADEPAASLDPRARFELREMFLLLREMGKTIFLSSHILRELDDVATHMGIIESGKIRISGLLEQVRQKMQSQIKVRLSLLDAVDDAQAWLAQQPVVKRVYPADEESMSGIPDSAYPTLLLLIDGDENTVVQV